MSTIVTHKLTITGAAATTIIINFQFSVFISIFRLWHKDFPILQYNINATPLGDRLTALHAIFRQIFRHFRQNLLEIRQYSCVDFVNLTKNYARNLTRNLCAVLP